jgi:16S rRNA (cytosine1402-N4)-methyltransferase
MNQAAQMSDASADRIQSARLHVPVMVAEVNALLTAHAPRTIADVTLGTGGHAEALLEATDARLIGLDRDAAALAVARERLARFGSRVTFHHANFSELDSILDRAGIQLVDAILADLGMSSFALEDSSRGFSFRFEGPLDMRMSPEQPTSAADLVNRESEADLASIIYQNGEERASRRIARAIVQARQRAPITTTRELRMLVERALGGHRRTGVHPATRTFQALRIAVNHELENLATLLERAPMRLAPGGRFAVIAYHSLEDRAVKQRFRTMAEGGQFALPARKAMRPRAAEIVANPRARSARLRCVERVIA